MQVIRVAGREMKRFITQGFKEWNQPGLRSKLSHKVQIRSCSAQSVRVKGKCTDGRKRKSLVLEESCDFSDHPRKVQMGLRKLEDGCPQMYACSIPKRILSDNTKGSEAMSLSIFLLAALLIAAVCCFILTPVLLVAWRRD